MQTYSVVNVVIYSLNMPHICPHLSANSCYFPYLEQLVYLLLYLYKLTLFPYPSSSLNFSF